MKKFTIASLILLLFAVNSNAQFAYNESWKYLDRGSDEGTTWRGLSFSDASWNTGSGKFGYGITGASTLILYGPDAKNKYVTTYFRKKINLVSGANFPNLGHILRDDGAIVYVNGTVVFRNNMPSGSITYTTKASNEATDNGNTSQIFPINSTLFVSGDNIIAVEIHQHKANNGDKDMAFDFKLESDQIAPEVISINRQLPSTNPTSATSVTFRATFSENVTGVNASDFTLNSTGALSGVISSVAAISSSVYDVTISPVNGNGTLRLDLKSTGTGIKDIAGNAIGSGFSSGQTYTFIQSTSSGFSSITPLSTIDITSATKDKPQAKAWFYANQWWCALAATGGTTIFRLDGATWTSVLQLTTSSSKTDCVVVGNLVHILGVRSGASLIYTVEYDPAANVYKLWNLRPNSSSLQLPVGQETGSIVVDGAGRMWVATAGTTDVHLWWSDSPYTVWSAPITIASGISDDDICTLAVIPSKNKIGIFWSNQVTKRFGFRTHINGDIPENWSADEVPASQSALNIGGGMADDHISLIAASDGTLYCAAKTSYAQTGYPQIILLIRRPAGTWDNVYPVAMYPEGTQPIVIVNENLGKIKVVYSTETYGGNIVYRESPTSTIAFGSTLTLMDRSPRLLNYATSTHQTYNTDVVIIASDEHSTPMQAFSVLARDGAPLSKSSTLTSSPMTPPVEIQNLTISPNPFKRKAIAYFTVPETCDYTITIYDSKGSKLSIAYGRAEARLKNSVTLNSLGLTGGIYTVRLQTPKSAKTVKVIINN